MTLKLISRSMLGLRNHNTESGLHDLYVTMAIQLPFFFDVSLVKHVDINVALFVAW